VKTNLAYRSQRGWTLIEVLAAVVVIGLGLALFTRVQHSSSRGTGENSRILQAGKAIEQFIEDTRIKIAKDTLVNFPPVNTSIAATAPNFIAIRSTVSNAVSPVDGAVVANVRRLDITASWTRPYKDSLKVTTYVSKRF
jgi:prepilin-type N-terminal cleavage/methylation domain-containing protein